MLKLLTLLFCIQVSLAEAATTPQKSASLTALSGLAAMHGFEADVELQTLIERFYQLEATQTLSDAAKERLFEEESIALWSGRIVEFIGLVDILWQDLPAADKAALKARYQKDRMTLKHLQDAMNVYVAKIHPGYRFLESKALQKFKGRGIKIAVFDLFDRDILLQQRSLYPRAKIADTLDFGKPVELSHGNTVIDIILTLAPEAEIIPVSSDSKAYTRALQAIVARPDIDIVNMSRTFAAEAKTTLKALARSQILVKSLGNTGADLDGVLNPRRVAAGLGPVNNLFAYDAQLIKDFYASDADSDLALYAMNLSLFARDMALSATIPGAFEAVASRTLAVPAEGVFSPSSQSYESGSSFAAPQITALAAMLLQAARQDSMDDGKKAVVESLKAAALPHADWGRGKAAGDAALDKLIPVSAEPR